MQSPSSPWAVSADDYPGDSFTSDQLEFLLGYAILAPSTHNTQPWLFRIRARDVEVYLDRRRAVRVVDPADRELTTSVGAALFNLRVAAEYFGHQHVLHLFPEPADVNLCARFELGLTCETRSDDVVLFHAITERRTNRHPFRSDPIPAEILQELVEAAVQEEVWLSVVEGEEARNRLADLVAEGDRRQWADRRFREELARWMRPKGDPHLDGMPVHDLGIKDWMSFAGPLLIRTFDRGEGQAARDRDIALYSPTLLILGTDGDDPRSWLKAGQALQHLLLEAQAEGVGVSYLNQPIEVAELRPEVAALTGRSGYPQLVLRLGYGSPAMPTPRRPVHDLLLRQPGHHST